MTQERRPSGAERAMPAAPARLLKSRRVVAAFWLTLATLACSACAGARIENVQAVHSLNLPRPARIVVFDFNTGVADVALPSPDEGESAPALAQSDLLAEAVADRVATRLVQNVASLGLPAERVVAGAAVPEVNDLVIEGDFVRVEPGSRALRFVIGFGAGASELRTRVRIFRVTAEGWEPVQQFETVATSSRFPGVAAVGAAAGSATTSAGLGAWREFRSAIDADAGRTAEQIAGRVSELKTAQRW